MYTVMKGGTVKTASSGWLFHQEDGEVVSEHEDYGAAFNAFYAAHDEVEGEALYVLSAVGYVLGQFDEDGEYVEV